MKKLLLCFMVTTITLTAICISQSHKVARQRAQLAALNGAAEEKSRRLESLEASAQRASQKLHELLGQNQELAAQIQASQKAAEQVAAVPPANPSTQPASPTESLASLSAKQRDEKNGLGNFLAKMMQDPQTKKFMRDQQRMMMDQLYGPLVKQMGLTTDESEKFKDLLADNMMKGAENSSSLLGGASTNRAEAFAALSAEQKDFDDKVKVLLGDERYASYKDYQQTVGERAQLAQFKQMGGAEYPLTDQQTEQLLAIMKEEKQAVTAATGQSFPAEDKTSFQTMLADDSQAEKLLQAQETVNERVYQRAGQVLAPDQLGSFARFQTNQLQMMRLGMTMARKFLAPDDSENQGEH